FRNRRVEIVLRPVDRSARVIGIGILGIYLDRPVTVYKRRIIITLAKISERAIVVGSSQILIVGRMELLNQICIVGDGMIQIVVVPVGATAFQVSFRVVWFIVDRMGILLDPLLPFTFPDVGKAEVVIGFGVFGAGRYRCGQ